MSCIKSLYFRKYSLLFINLLFKDIALLRAWFLLFNSDKFFSSLNGKGNTKLPFLFLHIILSISVFHLSSSLLGQVSSESMSANSWQQYCSSISLLFSSMSFISFIAIL